MCDLVEVGDKLVEAGGCGADNGHVVCIEKNFDELVEFVFAVVFDVELAIDGVRGGVNL